MKLTYTAGKTVLASSVFLGMHLALHTPRYVTN
jgi:hypothetical protein